MSSAIAGCSSGKEEPTATATDVATSVATADDNPTSTRTEPPTDDYEPAPVPDDFDPELIAIRIDPEPHQVGDSFTITTGCRADNPGRMIAVFTDSGNLAFALGDWMKLDFVGQNDTDPSVSVFQGTGQIGYWMSPGQWTLRTQCNELPRPDPYAITVDQPADGLPWNLWAPISPVTLVDAPAEHDVPIAAAVDDGEIVKVEAMCDPRTTTGQARFIVWTKIRGDRILRSEPFHAIEYPVPADGYEITPDGVRVTLDLEIRREDFADADEVHERERITALCTTTTPAFDPEGEPRENTTVELQLAWRDP